MILNIICTRSYNKKVARNLTASSYEFIYLSSSRFCRSSSALARICWTSIGSGWRLLMYNSWLPLKMIKAIVQLLAYHAESKNSLIYPQSLDPKSKVGRLLVNRLDHKLPVRERNVSDFAPWETNLRRELILLFVNVQP